MGTVSTPIDFPLLEIDTLRRAHIATHWLDDKHSILGAVQGETDQAVVDAIAGGDSIVKITVSGDVEELLAAQEAQVTAWNAVLDG